MHVRNGTVKSFDSGAYTATVQLAGSLLVWLTGIPVARNIPSAEVLPDRKCAIVFFDDTNPNDAVLIAVYI